MNQSGVDYDLAFLRPLSWIKSTEAKVGGSIHMELDEMGLNGPAEVVAIDTCPDIEADDGTGRNVVTGTMAHPGDNILYLGITGLDEPLGNLIGRSSILRIELRPLFVSSPVLHEKTP